MSLGLVAWCANGVALCADSRSSFPDATKQGVFRIATDNTEKLFKIGDVGVVTSGGNIFLDDTVFGHMRTFVKDYPAKPPSEVARDLCEFYLDLYKRNVEKYPLTRVGENQTAIEFLIGGYEGDEPCCYKAVIGEQKEGEKIEFTTQRGPVTVTGGVGSWRLDHPYNFGWIGDSDVVESLVLGYNVSILGNNPAWAAAARQVPIGLFALQDCVDLLYFLCQATEKMKHFSSGDGSKFGVNRTVGGPIDVAVVRKIGGFEFVKKKELRLEPQLDNAPRIESDSEETNPLA